MLSFATRKALREFQLEAAFTVTPGQTLVIIGPSGAGKTSILAQIAGLLDPDEGRITVGDRVLFDSVRGTNMPPERRRLGYVFQDYALFPHLTVRANVAYGMAARRMPRDEVAQRTQGTLEMLGIEALADQRPSAISGGERQRVALARAIAGGDPVLLLDEPLAALDAQMRQGARGDLRRVIEAVGAAAVFVTHDYVDALVFGDAIAVMDRGRVVQMGTQEDLLLRPRAEFVAEFMGVNFYVGTARQGTASGTSQVDVGTTEIAVSNCPTGRVFLAFPPSAVTVDLERPLGSALNVLEGHVTTLLQLGGRIRVEIDAGIRVVAELTPESVARLRLRVGSRVYASFKATAVQAYT